MNEYEYHLQDERNNHEAGCVCVCVNAYMHTQIYYWRSAMWEDRVSMC